jgi:hypothetical protein
MTPRGGEGEVFENRCSRFAENPRGVISVFTLPEKIVNYILKYSNKN